MAFASPIMGRAMSETVYLRNTLSSAACYLRYLGEVVRFLSKSPSAQSRGEVAAPVYCHGPYGGAGSHPRIVPEFHREIHQSLTDNKSIRGGVLSRHCSC